MSRQPYKKQNPKLVLMANNSLLKHCKDQSNVVSFFSANFASNTFCTRASSALMAKIGSCKLE
jgi:hypothetical protein